MQNLLLITPVLLPLLGGIPVYFMNERTTRRRYMGALMLAVLLCTFLLHWEGESLELLRLTPDLRLILRADSVGRLFGTLVAFIWFIVMIYADEYMTHEHHQPRFFAFYTMSLGALMGVCLAGSMVTLYLFYELMTLLTVPLVMHLGTDASIDAGIKYLGFSVCGAAMALLGLFYVSGLTTTDVFVPGGSLDPLMAQQYHRGLSGALLLMILGFGAKAGMLPLFTWLPAAHPVAPSPASGVLSGLITKMGVLAILRTIYFQFGPGFFSGSRVQKIVLALAILTIFVGSMLAFKEHNLKKRLAYSTVSQVSYILFGLFLVSGLGMAGALLQLVFHAFAKNGLFLAAGCIMFYLHRTRVTQLRGAGKQLPWAMAGFTLCSLSLIGVPPLAGFVSKWSLAQAGLDYGGAGIFGVCVLMVSALLTAGYLLPIVTDSFFVGADFNYDAMPKQKTSWRTKAPLLLFAIVVLVLGIFPGLLDGAITPIVTALFG